MMKCLLSSIVALLATTPVMAEPVSATAKYLPPLTECVNGPLDLDLRIDDGAFILMRPSMSRVLLDQKALFLCHDDLEDCELRECESCGPADYSFFDMIGVHGMVTGLLVVVGLSVAGGLLLGHELSKPRDQ